MRHLIRRLTIFPLFLVLSPLLYLIAWCMEGHVSAIKFIKEILSDAWEGF